MQGRDQHEARLQTKVKEFVILCALGVEVCRWVGRKVGTYRGGIWGPTGGWVRLTGLTLGLIMPVIILTGSLRRITFVRYHFARGFDRSPPTAPSSSTSTLPSASVLFLFSSPPTSSHNSFFSSLHLLSLVSVPEMPDLKATYSASIEEGPSKEFTTPLPAVSDQPSTDDRIAYLEKLRDGVVQLQEDINRLLTSKMDEDKAKAAAAGKKSTVDDAKEEENYGEEVVDDA